MSTPRVSRSSEVRDGLLDELVSGRAPVGSKLPNEQELATRYSVSRATVREAVTGLVDGGYLVRRHGSGTYVTSLPRRQHSLDRTLSYTQMIRDAGMTPGMRVLGISVRPANDTEAHQLDLGPGEPVRELRRIRTADDRPIIYSIDVVGQRWVGELPDSAFTGSLFDLLATVGVLVRTATAVLLPVNATSELAGVLDVRRGAAVQQISEIDFTADGNPVLSSLEWHVPGVFELRVNRRP